MSMGKKKEIKKPELRQIIGFTKPKKILFFKTKPKPIYGAPIKQPQQAETQPNQQEQPFVVQQNAPAQPQSAQPVVQQQTAKPAMQKTKQPKQPHQGFFKGIPDLIAIIMSLAAKSTSFSISFPEFLHIRYSTSRTDPKSLKSRRRSSSIRESKRY